MSVGQFGYVEQDRDIPAGGNELPSYDDLATQNGPNSRFGRWRGWIEKRAAERYADITPEERSRRRARGWGNDVENPRPVADNVSVFSQTSTLHDAEQSLHIQTASLSIKESPPQSNEDVSSISLPFVSEPIEGSHLKINHFGSRFLPHTSRPIRSMLPLQGDRMVLVGHDNGLSVLDMFPKEWTGSGDLTTTGPGDARCWPIWEGETVYQMSLLEMEDNGSGVPQGVVLAIVGPSSDATNPTKEMETARTARMYNLASLVNLARWTVSQKGAKPINLYTVSSLQVPASPKKHRQQGSIARSFISLTQTHSPTSEPTQTYPNLLYSPSSTVSTLRSSSPSELGEAKLVPNRRDSDESGWDVIEDTALRWATDFKHLAVPGSRLASSPAICFATWSDDTRKGKGMGGQLLAVATKNNIVLYETPKGERAYRFVKEFYTPLQPRSMTFVHQAFNDSYRSPIEVGPGGKLYNHKRTNSNASSFLKGVVNSASSSVPLRFGTHLSLFVVFDKKAGVIRLADSAVEEVELGDDGGSPLYGTASVYPSSSVTSSSQSLRRQRARLSSEIRESASKWVTPVRCELPVAGFPVDQGITEPVHVLTRGKRTHVVPCPLPIKSSAYPPLHSVFWKSHSKHVSARVIVPETDLQADSAILQLVSFSENGIEVYETGLGFMHMTKGKGRAVDEIIVHAEEDLGETGFLGSGGNWDRMDQIFLGQRISRSAAMGSSYSVDTVDSVEISASLKREEGIYGWYRKDSEDWRVFWVGAQ